MVAYLQPHRILHISWSCFNPQTSDRSDSWNGTPNQDPCCEMQFPTKTGIPIHKTELLLHNSKLSKSSSYRNPFQSKANCQGIVDLQDFTGGTVSNNLFNSGLIHTVNCFAQCNGFEWCTVNNYMGGKKMFPVGRCGIDHFNDGGMLIAKVV